MIDQNQTPEEDPQADPFEGCKPLTGVCMTIAKPDKEKKHGATVLGVFFAPNLDKLKEGITAIHSEQLAVQLRHVKPGQLKMIHETKG